MARRADRESDQTVRGRQIVYLPPDSDEEWPGFLICVRHDISVFFCRFVRDGKVWPKEYSYPVKGENLTYLNHMEAEDVEELIYDLGYRRQHDPFTN